MNMTPRLKTKYSEEIIAKLVEEFNYSNVMMVPQLEKIVVSQGIGAAVADKKLVDQAIVEMTTITGQKAVPTKSKKDVSNFKLRMYEFLDRLISASLPRIRDFRGIKSSGFDGRGNYTFGITEQIIFPEIDIDKVNRISGMDITFVTSASTDKEAKALLTAFGIPFTK